MLHLTPDSHDASRHLHNPYELRGARPILRRFRDDVVAMLQHCEKIESIFGEEAKILLVTSPLRSKIWVAAAMITTGLLKEIETETGAITFQFTPKGRQSIDQLTRFL